MVRERRMLSRRDFSRLTVIGALAVPWVGLSAGRAAAADRGTLIDYSAGIPRPADIRAAGHRGAIRYVSDPRPNAAWMIGKPMRAVEAQALVDDGLDVVSCYQFGKAETADWRGGYSAGIGHAARGLQLHQEAGGPPDRPIYAAIDDDPTREDFDMLIDPYLRGWADVIGPRNVGLYANSGTIDWAIEAGIGQWFWQHNWGTPAGYVHPAAHLHQVRIDDNTVGGVGVDINNVLADDFGQWYP
ncbi:DUF1906 domain-containing protein [Millisia brevis]|uniref:DUF1906 domain-containing protein n=1 Tax=Millisia brevis TaxID=264148 RepID=UPI00082B697B|nr:DUF1906 domain-containing protein [Millisia brevis]